jgi:hypothetical protein
MTGYIAVSRHSTLPITGCKERRFLRWVCYKHLHYLTGNDANWRRGVKKLMPNAEFKRRFRATSPNDITNNMSAAESFT